MKQKLIYSVCVVNKEKKWYEFWKQSFFIKKYYLTLDKDKNIVLGKEIRGLK